MNPKYLSIRIAERPIIIENDIALKNVVMSMIDRSCGPSATEVVMSQTMLYTRDVVHMTKTYFMTFDTESSTGGRSSLIMSVLYQSLYGVIVITMMFRTFKAVSPNGASAMMQEARPTMDRLAQAYGPYSSPPMMQRMSIGDTNGGMAISMTVAQTAATIIPSMMRIS